MHKKNCVLYAHFNGLVTTASTEYLFLQRFMFVMFSKLSETRSHQARFFIIYFVHIL